MVTKPNRLDKCPCVWKGWGLLAGGGGGEGGQCWKVLILTQRDLEDLIRRQRANGDGAEWDGISDNNNNNNRT